MLISVGALLLYQPASFVACSSVRSNPFVPPTNLTYEMSGIDLDLPLAPYAAEWRLLTVELFCSFSEHYAKLSHAFFAWFRAQQHSNAAIIIGEVGVLGRELPAAVRLLWKLATELWVGLRGILSDIERTLESYLVFLGNALRRSLPRRLRNDAAVRELHEETRRAIRAADAGYERNYERCWANYMREVRRQVNGLEELCWQAWEVREYAVGRTLMQERMREFYTGQNRRLLEVMRSYWDTSMVVYGVNWKRYCAAFVGVLKEM